MYKLDCGAADIAAAMSFHCDLDAFCEEVDGEEIFTSLCTQYRYNHPIAFADNFRHFKHSVASTCHQEEPFV